MKDYDAHSVVESKDRSAVADPIAKVTDVVYKSTVNSLSIKWKKSADAAVDGFLVTLAVVSREQRLVAVAQAKIQYDAAPEQSFHYLPHDLRVAIIVQALHRKRQSEPTIVWASTSSPPNGFQQHGPLPIYVGPEHVLDASWLSECPSDYMWATSRDYNFMVSILRHGLFYLDESCYALVPNPRQRYVIPLNENIKWARNKKLRRHARDFTLSVNKDFVASSKICQRYHIWKNERTWLTDELISTLDQLRRDTDSGIHICAFELWEGHDLVAASFGYGVGRVFMDYTFCTLRLDSRSVGGILTRALGDVLTKAGYTHWYWGFALQYMHDYDAYGGKELSRKEFYEILGKEASCVRKFDPVDVVASGRAVISSTL